MKKILIADDEFLIRYSLSHMLRSASVDVIAVANGNDALREISNAFFDLCCLDIHLPDMNGIDLMKRIRVRHTGTRIIMMTGGDVTETMLAAINKDSELFLSKPFDLFKVKAFVDRLLAPAADPASITSGPVRACGPSYGLGNDQRRHPRYPAARDAATVFKDQTGRTAEILDRSDGGMCLMTTYSLERGMLLKISNNKTGHCMGTVRWSMRTGDADLFRSGVEFTPGA